MADIAISRMVCGDGKILSLNGECSSMQGMFLPPLPVFGSSSFVVSCIGLTLVACTVSPLLGTIASPAVACLWSIVGVLIIVSKGEDLGKLI